MKKQLGALIQALSKAHPDLDPSSVEALSLLIQERPADEAAAETLTTRLEQAFVPLTRAKANFEGSLEERIEVISGALRAQQIVGRFGFLVSVFADTVIACDPGQRYYSEYDDEDSKAIFYRVPYTVTDDNHTVAFGERVAVDVHMIAVPAGAAVPGLDLGDPETDPAEQSQDAGAGTVPTQGASGAKSSEEDDMPEWLRQGHDPPGGEEILVQSQSVLLQTDSYDQSSGVLKVQGVATTAETINGKKQVYPLQVWLDNVPRLQRLAQSGRLVGESEHPTNHASSIERTVIKFTDLWQDGNQLKFKADILPTKPHGENIITLIQNGIPVDISSRGRGTTKKSEWNGVPDVSIVQRGFCCDTFDCVIAGASPGSTITDWQTQSAAADQIVEEDAVMKELLEKLAAQMETLAASQKAQEEKLAGLEQSKVEPKTEEVPAKTEAVPDPAIQKAAEMTALMEQSLVRGRLEDMVQTLGQKTGWGPQWVNAFRKQLQNAECKTLEALEQTAVRAEEIITQLVADAPKYPGNGHIVQANRGERGPKNPREFIEILCSDLPDDVPGNGSGDLFMQQDAEGNPIHTGEFLTPRRQLRRILTNVAKHVDEHFNGPAAIMAATRLAQGVDPRRVQEDFLDQSISTGYTAVGDGGAPQSAPFIFPLIRRVFPQLFAQEIASIQPLDRPDGKIFFLDFVRVTPGSNYTDAAGNTVSNRTRMDVPSSFSSSYSDDPGETATAQMMQLKLSALSVSVENRKLYAAWSMEEMQDLRAYHGLDAGYELVNALSTEVALEWNQVILAEILAGATAGNRTFNTTAPSGYTQKEWDEYISRYLHACSNDIFKKRNGEYTHLVAGPDAWLKLGAAFRSQANPVSGFNPEQYAGIQGFQMVEGPLAGVKAYKTSLWGSQNTNSVLVIRRGSTWSDTPYVWAPYMDTLTPVLTTPEVFTQRQGIMSRVAHKVVVGDAIATLTIASGTGVPL